MDIKELIEQIEILKSRIKGLERKLKRHATCIDMIGTNMGDLNKIIIKKRNSSVNPN